MKSITRSTIDGCVAAPPSKSMMGRAVAAALLAEGTSVIENPSFCDDGRTALSVALKLGAVLSEGETLAVRGTGIKLQVPKEGAIDCGESGLCMRMFAPIVALCDGEAVLSASGSLRTRPMGMLEQLSDLGASCATQLGRAPIRVRGPMKGGNIRLDASVTSQFLTGLLMALPLCSTDSRILVSDLKSRPYVRMTLELVRRFGVAISTDDRLEEFQVAGNQTYRPSTYQVEGDWSGAAFILVAGALAGCVTVTGLDIESHQADRAILDALRAAGARVTTGNRSVTVEREMLKGFSFDATDCPDLFPPLVALASGCQGTSTIRGSERLTHKESDRAHALAQEFGKLGISIREHGGSMEVVGGIIRNGAVDAHNDHRIAMACAVAALRAKGEVVLTGDESVSKSYPHFFSDLRALGVKR